MGHTPCTCQDDCWLYSRLAKIVWLEILELEGRVRWPFLKALGPIITRTRVSSFGLITVHNEFETHLGFELVSDFILSRILNSWLIPKRTERKAIYNNSHIGLSMISMFLRTTSTIPNIFLFFFKSVSTYDVYSWW